MNRRNMLALSAGTLAAAMLLGHASGALAQDATTITYGQSTAIRTLDPARGAFTGYPAGYEAALVIYDRLLDFDANMEITPQLAQSFEMADDLMSATITLREGVTFHDGTALDAAAVKTNLDRMIDAQRNPTNRPLWDPLESVETPDENTVVINLKIPFSQLPNTLAHGSGAIVSPAAIEAHGDEGIAQNPVGAGPFRMTSFSPGQELVVEAFDDYWGGRPETDRIVFRHIAEPATRISALQTGAVDVIDAVPVALVSQLQAAPSIEVLSAPGLRPIGFALNMTREPMKDANVRKALNLAIPVQIIAERVFFGFARAPDSPLAFNTAGYSPVAPLTYDVEEAKALLAAAGHGDDNPLSLTMLAPQGLFPGDASVAEIVAASLGEAGVNVEITQVESGSYWDALRLPAGELTWDLAMFGFNPSNASGLYHLSSLFRSNPDDAARPAVWNIARYRNAEVDALLAEADATVDAAAQNEALAKAQALIWNEFPYIWLQVNENVSAVRSGVEGVEVWPIVFTNLRDATK